MGGELCGWCGWCEWCAYKTQKIHTKHTQNTIHTHPIKTPPGIAPWHALRGLALTEEDPQNLLTAEETSLVRAAKAMALSQSARYDWVRGYDGYGG